MVMPKPLILFLSTPCRLYRPEYLYDSKQVIRAGLEDHFMAKLSGIPMDRLLLHNHMMADQNDIENLGGGYCGRRRLQLLYSAFPQAMILCSTTKQCLSRCRRHPGSLGLRPIKEFERWLEKMG
jgi:ethanolamine ammonia-lyase large subunit